MKIVVTTCDTHVEVVPLFLKYWYRAWPDCPWRIEIVANTILPEVPQDIIDAGHVVICHRLGPDEGWSANMLDYLRRIDKDEPFVLMLEDYLVTELSSALMIKAYSAIKRARAGMVRLVPIPGPTKQIENDDDIGLIDKNEPYAISLQAAIWEPQVLIDLLDPMETPWQLETKGSQRAKSYDRYQFLALCEPALHYVNYLRRGVPRKSAVEWVEQHP